MTTATEPKIRNLNLNFGPHITDDVRRQFGRALQIERIQRLLEG